MSELNKELKEYLSRNDKSDKESLLPVTIKDIKISQFGSWFNKTSENKEEDSCSTSSTISNHSNASTSSWFSSNQSDPCLPSLVCMFYI